MDIFFSASIISLFSFLCFFGKLFSSGFLFNLVNQIILFTEFRTLSLIVLKHSIPCILVKIKFVTCMLSNLQELFFSFFFLECFHLFTNCNLSFLLVLNYFVFSKFILLDHSFFCSIFFKILHDDGVPLIFCWIQVFGWICVVNSRSSRDTRSLTHHIRLSSTLHTSNTSSIRLNSLFVSRCMSFLYNQLSKSFVNFMKLTLI